MSDIPGRFVEINESPERVFVIGDLHGCFEELSQLVQHLKSEVSLRASDLVVFVGDYIDRGPCSKEVVDFLLQFRKEFPKTIFLKGNHEEMLISYLGVGSQYMAASYLHNGGTTTLQSYGIKSDVAGAECRKRLPEEHLEFFLSLDRYLIMPSWVVTHAGLSPLRDLKAQVDQDLFWIRDEFITNRHYFERLVVFGHTPYWDILFNKPYKIGIDTGLVYGNMLTCIELVNEQVYQIEHGSTKVHSLSFRSKGDKVAVAKEVAVDE